MTKKEFIDTLKQIFDLPVEKKEIEVPVTEAKVEIKAEEKTPETEPAPADTEKEDIKAILTDLQKRVAIIEGQLSEMTKENTELKSVQEKMNKVIEVIKNEPQSEEPKKTESAFSENAKDEKKTKEQKRLEIARKYFVPAK